MRAIDPDIEAQMRAGATTLARAWRVTRTDGTVFGFTEHDVDIVCEGTAYKASQALDGGVREAQRDGAGAEEAIGVFDDDGVDADELAAGLWDGARVEALLLDWTTRAVVAVLYGGRIGPVRRDGAVFRATFEDAVAALQRPLGRTFARRCDASFGDARCGVDASSWTRDGVIVRVDGRSVVVDGALAFGEAAFVHGVLQHGPVDVVVEAQAGLALTLERAIPLQVGDAVTLVAGCDKRFETCRNVFANSVRFRGFPHMIGDDGVVAGPDRAQALDGGSRWR